MKNERDAELEIENMVKTRYKGTRDKDIFVFKDTSAGLGGKL